MWGPGNSLQWQPKLKPKLCVGLLSLSAIPAIAEDFWRAAATWLTSSVCWRRERPWPVGMCARPVLQEVNRSGYAATRQAERIRGYKRQPTYLASGATPFGGLEGIARSVWTSPPLR